MSPSIVGAGRFAQRIVHPNGTKSEPFVVPLSKATMVWFATRVFDGDWPKPAADFPEEERDDLGSCRIELAYQGGFRRTLEAWGRHGDYAAMMNAPMPRRSSRLSYGDVLIAFLELGEGGAPTTYLAMGGTDILHDLALTTSAWALRVEEWT